MQNNDYMKGHFVPKVFQKRWKVLGTNESVYFLKKKEKFLSISTLTIKAGNILYRDYYYYLELQNKYLQYQYFQSFPLFFKKIMERYENMEIIYKSKHIENKEDFTHNFKHFKEFKIINNGVKLDIIKEWNEIKELWAEGEYRVKLEKSFNSIETQWNVVLDRVINVVNNDCIFQSTDRELLLEFIAVQFIRIYESKMVTEVIALSSKIVLEGLTIKGCPELYLNTKHYLNRHKRDSWIKDLLKYYNTQPVEESNITSNKVNVIRDKINDCQIFIIKTIESALFISSDRPVVHTQSKAGSGNITIMPLTPNYCLLLAKNSFDKDAVSRYDVLVANDLIVGYINHLMCKNSKEGIISNKITFFRNRKYPKNSLENMFAQLKYINLI